MMEEIFGLFDSPLEKSLIFDSHAHYDDGRFDSFRDELLKELKEQLKQEA